MRAHSNNRAPSAEGRTLTFFQAVIELAHAATNAVWDSGALLYARHKNRQGVRQMLNLDDHMLRDMGVTRYDVMRAARSPLTHNAGEVLSRASRCRQGPSASKGKA